MYKLANFIVSIIAIIFYVVFNRLIIYPIFEVSFCPAFGYMLLRLPVIGFEAIILIYLLDNRVFNTKFISFPKLKLRHYISLFLFITLELLIKM